MKIFYLVSLFSLSVLIFSCDEDDKTEESTGVRTIEFLGETYSCGDFSINVLQNEGDTQRALLLSGESRVSLMLTEEVQTFDLPLEGLTVEIMDYDLSINNGHFCNDVFFGELPKIIENWNVVSGTINLSISNFQETVSNFESPYNITVVLENAIFENESGEQLKIEQLILEELGVGWYPG